MSRRRLKWKKSRKEQEKGEGHCNDKKCSGISGKENKTKKKSLEEKKKICEGSTTIKQKKST